MPAKYEVSTLVAKGVLSTTFSADGTHIFTSSTRGRIVEYDVATGQQVASWNAKASIGAISVSDDGHYLLAAGHVASRGVVLRLDLGTGEVERFGLQGGGFLDVQVVDDHRAVVTGNGSDVLTLDFVSGEFTPLANAVNYSTYSDLTRNGRYTLLGERGISNGPLALYDSRAGEIVARGDDYQDHVGSGFNWGIQAVSAKAGMIVQYVTYGDVNIYDMSLHGIGTVNLGGYLGGLLFDASGRHLFAYDVDTGKVNEFNTSDWSLFRSYDVGASNWNNTENYGDQLHLSADGRYLSVLNTNTGSVTLVDLAPRLDGSATFANAVDPHAFGNDDLGTVPQTRLGDHDWPVHIALA